MSEGKLLSPAMGRRHDLDALRAIAMLLGIVLHGLMPFIGLPEKFFPLQDVSQMPALGVILSGIHGFRMPLFFLISGFFTTMLWRRRGLNALIKHRFKRIFLPLGLGLLTIIPLTNMVYTLPYLSREMSEVPTDVQQRLTLVQKSTAVNDSPQSNRIELNQLGADAFGPPSKDDGKIELNQLGADAFGPRKPKEDVITTLMYIPVFHHLWFLWYLCWLIAAFCLWGVIAGTFKIKLPNLLVLPPVCFLWVLPLTYFFQNQMGLDSTGSFGPDTATGLIPVPAILGFYAVFFFYGAWYYDSDDSKGKLGKYWWFSLPLAQLIIHPIGLEFASGHLDITKTWIESAAFWLDGLSIDTQSVTTALTEPANYRLFSVLSQVAYAWLMTTGCLGVFRKFFNKESKTMRYVSDSSYWLYLAHIPLLFLLQYCLSSIEVTALIKVPLTIIVCSAILLLSYEYCVRYTALGTLLNGPKTRPGEIPTAVATPQPLTTTPVDLSKYKNPPDGDQSS